MRDSPTNFASRVGGCSSSATQVSKLSGNSWGKHRFVPTRRQVSSRDFSKDGVSLGMIRGRATSPPLSDAQPSPYLDHSGPSGSCPTTLKRVGFRESPATTSLASITVECPDLIAYWISLPMRSWLPSFGGSISGKGVPKASERTTSSTLGRIP